MNHSSPPKRAESDVVQIALFIAVGVVTARLVNDADRLRRLATTDDSTGLHNLRSFEARLAKLLCAARQEEAPLYIAAAGGFSARRKTLPLRVRGSASTTYTILGAL